jgi:hypothetical protein
MEGDGRAGRLRSFVLGGLVGAAGAIATRDRLSRARALRDGPGGLEAFEGAPCFQERLGDDGESREPDDLLSDPSAPD